MSGRILVADNDAEMLDLLRRHLESDGHVVTTTSSGSGALAAVERDEVDVILTDLVMDEVDGLALLRAAQATAARRPRDPHDRLRKPGDGHRGHAPGRLRLPDQAVQAGRGHPGRPARAGGPPPARGEPAAARPDRGALRTRRPAGALPGHADGPRADPRRGRLGGQRAASRRERHRQDPSSPAGCTSSSPRSASPFVTVHCSSRPWPATSEPALFGHRKGAFAGATGAAGQGRAGAARKPVPRRGRRAQPRPAGQAPPRAPGERDPTRRRLGAGERDRHPPRGPRADKGTSKRR